MAKANETFYELENFVPSLREEVEKNALDLNKILRLALPVEDPNARRRIVPAGMDRTTMIISDGTKFCEWKTESLRALFRGDKKPPVLGDTPPQEYTRYFVMLEAQVLEISEIYGDRPDDEMKEIYSMLRRRPDGRSLGFVHDYMWQASALMLGTCPLSQAEFEAITGRLERSCRTFSFGPTSRNYVAAIRRIMDFGSSR